MPELRFQFIRFHLAVTDEEVRELIKPYEAARIERGEREGLVLFNGGDHIEEDEMRGRFNALADEYIRKQKESAVPWSFDADAWLRSRGFDPDELRALQPRKRADCSKVENSYDWVIKHRRVAR